VDEQLILPGRPFNYQARDAGALLAAMRALIPDTLPEWTGFDSKVDFGTVLLELFAHMGDVIGYYADAVANESFLGTAQTRRSVIEHLRLIGYRLAPAAPAAALLTVTLKTAPKSPVMIRPGAAFGTAGRTDAPVVRFEYTGAQDLTLTFNDALRATITVEEGRRISEVVGIGDGSPYQRFALLHPQLILRSANRQQDLVLTDSTNRAWTLRDTLAFSRPDQTDFSVEIDELDRAEVVFGEQAPDRGAILQATYRVGGGAQGNVAAHTIETILDAPALATAGATVTNVARATGGAERETIDHAVRHAPAVYRSMGRAVTAADYEALALAFGGVGKVRASAELPLGAVTLYLAPQGGGLVSDVLAGGLVSYFEDKRPIGTRVSVQSVDWVPIFMTAEVDVQTYYSGPQVLEQVRQAVQQVLAFDRVSFGQVVYLSKFFEAIEAVDGVAGVNITEFTRPGQDPAVSVPPTGKLVLGDRQLPRIPEQDDFALHPGTAPAPYPGGVRVRSAGGPT
jgi:phage-related baseplate assembly protein